MKIKRCIAGILLSGMLFANCQAEAADPSGDVQTPEPKTDFKTKVIGSLIGAGACGGTTFVIGRSVKTSLIASVVGAVLGYVGASYFVESDFLRSENELLTLKNEVADVLMSRQVAEVQQSYEKTISHELTNVFATRPFGVIMNRLRGTVQKVMEIVEICSKNQSICLQKAKNDERYQGLAKEYGALIETIKTEFPFDLFEQRVVEVYSSENFRAEVEVLEQEIRHKEIVEVLTTIRSGLDNIITDVREEISRVRKSISEVKEGVNENRNTLSNVESDVISARNLILDFDVKLNALKNVIKVLEDETMTACGKLEENLLTTVTMVADLQRDISQLKNNVSAVPQEVGRQLSRIEGVLISTSNLVSCLEHDVSNITNKLSKVGCDDGQTVQP